MAKEATDTLIMTSAINPVCETPGVRITDSRTRLFQLCCSIVCWAQTEEIKNIVICDNTLPELNAKALRRMGDQHEKDVELLSFLADRHSVATRGKGFGEGEILKYVFENSNLIGRCSSFYKITGRLYVGNFGLIHRAHKNRKRVFDNPIPHYRRFAKRVAVHLSENSRHVRGMVGTVFYKCDSDFFKKNLLHRNKLVNDHQRFYLEHSYFLPLIKSGFSSFETKPDLVGFSGSSGALYQNLDYTMDVKKQAHELMAAL